MLPLTVQRRMAAFLSGHRYAKAAIDIAVHDALGKSLGASVAALLGGAVTDRVPSYYATGVGDPDEIARTAADKLAEGYPRLQVKVGGRPVEFDIETIRKVRERIGGSGVRLAVDADRSLTTRDALRVSRELTHIPFVLEQPCDTVDDLRKIRPQMRHAIYMDENAVDLPTVIAAACTHVGATVRPRPDSRRAHRAARGARARCRAGRDDVWRSGGLVSSGPRVSAGPGVNLAGQHALVTGAAGGIGAAVVAALRAAGARVAVADRDPGGIEADAHLPGDLTDAGWRGPAAVRSSTSPPAGASTRVRIMRCTA